MTVSIGAATDYIFSKAQGAVIGVIVNGKPAQASDGWPDEPSFGQFVVGATAPPPDGTSDITLTRPWADVGDGQVEEDYGIPCYIDVRISGKNQKAARDAAESIFNTFWASIAADLTLGGLLTGVGAPAEIDEVRSTGLSVGTVPQPGRRQLISFVVHCRNVTT